MIEEAEIKVRNPKKLRQVLESSDARDDSRGYVTGGSGEDEQVFSSSQRLDRGNQGTDERASQLENDAGRLGEGTSSPSGSPIDTTPVSPSYSGRPETVVEDKAEIEREKARQRQKRHRDKQKEQLAGENTAQSSSKPLRDSDASDKKPNFILAGLLAPKKGEKVPVELIRNAEVDETVEKLTDLFIQGTGLLDDLLQITVKGHEEVQIWQAEEYEAKRFALMMVERAKKDKRAASQVRFLISIHDQMFILLYIAPRAVATKNHIKDHGGFSFK